jgi:hypothetical protein
MPRTIRRWLKQLEAWLDPPALRADTRNKMPRPLRDALVTLVLTVAACTAAAIASAYDAHVGDPEFDLVTMGLIGGAAAIVCLTVAYLAWCEELSLRWAALPIPFALPLLLMPLMVFEDLQDHALTERGVAETCVVEESVERRSTRGSSAVEHTVSCPSGHFEFMSKAEERLQRAAAIEVTLDPEGRVEPEFHEPPETTLGGALLKASATMLVCVAIRLVYLYVRLWVTRSHSTGRRTRRPGVKR